MQMPTGEWVTPSPYVPTSFGVTRAAAGPGRSAARASATGTSAARAGPAGAVNEENEMVSNLGIGFMAPPGGGSHRPRYRGSKPPTTLGRPFPRRVSRVQRFSCPGDSAWAIPGGRLLAVDRADVAP